MYKKVGDILDVLPFILRYETILRERKIPKMKFYKDCKITDAAVSQWRSGKNHPALGTVERIAEYLSVTPEYLLTGENGRNEKPATISDDGFSEVDEVFRKLSPENREKLLEIARLYIESQHNQ